MRGSIPVASAMILIASGCFGQPAPLVGGTEATTADDMPETSVGESSMSSADTTGASMPATSDDSSTSAADTDSIEPSPACPGGGELTKISSPVFDQASEFVDVARIGDALWVLGDVVADPRIGRTLHAWELRGIMLGSPVVYALPTDNAAVRLLGDGPVRAFANQGSGINAFIGVHGDPNALPWGLLGQVSGAQPTAAWDAVRDGPALYAVGYGTNEQDSRYWRRAVSTDEGMTWVDDVPGFQLTFGLDAEALAIDVTASGRVITAGYGIDESRSEHWIVRGSDPGGAPDELLDLVAFGRARAVLALADDMILAGGDLLERWTLRVASRPGTPFQQVDLLAGSLGYVADLAIGPDGIFLALGTTRRGADGLTLLACDGDPIDARCWIPLIEHDELIPNGDTIPRRMFVDDRDIWIAGSATTPDGTATVGALYRLTCAAR